MISQTAEYALRAVTWLALHTNSPQTTSQIAKGMNIPAGYLSKVLQTMVRAGLVASRRGLGGGFTLQKDPSEITPLEVINTVDPLKRFDVCPLGQTNKHKNKLCPLHDRLYSAMALIENAFGSCSIQELCLIKDADPVDYGKDGADG